MQPTQTAKRLNITISQNTWQKMKAVVPRMERSRFIDRVLRAYLVKMKTSQLKALLKDEAIRNREIDLQVADEWLALDAQQWDAL